MGKTIANLASLVLVLPLAWLCWFEALFRPHRVGMFNGLAECFALLPGLPGRYLRRAFYFYVLDECSLESNLSFGMIFTKRQVVVKRGVYVGLHAIIGSARLEEECLVGSRCSLLSGPQIHQLGDDGKWGPTEMERVAQITVGSGAWLGEGAITMADVGEGAMVSAGAVVSSNVPAHVMVAGNPARFVKSLVETNAAAVEREEKQEQVANGR